VVLAVVLKLSGQLTFIPEMYELLAKSCAKFDSLIVNIRCTTACEKLTLKFRLLYPLNYISCFNVV